MAKRFLVEIVVCEYDEDGKRWTANGHVVSEEHTKEVADRLAAWLIEIAGHHGIKR